MANLNKSAADYIRNDTDALAIFKKIEQKLLEGMIKNQKNKLNEKIC